MKYLTKMCNKNRTESLLRVFAGMFLAAAFVMLPATVRADSTATYQISGTLASGGTYAGTIELDHSTSTGLTTLINSNFTVDGISFTCNGQTGGNQCLVYAPFGPDYFQVTSGTHLFLLEWSQINLAGPYPPTLNFFTGYCTTCSGVGNDAVQNGGVGTYVATPENSTILLFGVGLVGLVLLARRRSNSRFVA
jgi:hypothetical protein